MNVGALELFFGRLHPMVLHAPIGLLIGLAALELIGLVRRRAIPRDVSVPLVWLIAVSAVLTALTGLTLAQEAATATDTLNNHKLLGISVAVGATLTAAAATRANWRAAYRGLLVLTVGLLLPAGHLGASMTHGETFLTEPFSAARSQAAALATNGPPPGSESAGDPHASAEFHAVAEIFAEKCGSCHGADRQRGQLALHSPDRIRAGGKHGPVLVAGKPEQSEMLRRLRLPVDDRSHMPPSSRPQPEAREILLIEQWIAAGAAMDDSIAGTNGAGLEKPREEVAPPNGPAEPPPDAAAIEALRARLIHVEPTARAASTLWIDCSAAGHDMSDADLRSLLAPLREHVAVLSLARSQVGHDTIAVVADMPALTRLDLSSTAIDDADVSKLAALPKLEELVLTRTRVTDEVIESVKSMKGLRRLYVWKSGLTDGGVATLREKRPDDLLVDAGDRPDAAGSDAETELKFSSDAPLPGQAPLAAAATALQPVNSICPVSGTPVDPKYVVVWKGRAIGFCCPNCPTKFWADPAAYEAKLPAPVPAATP
jgi:uncharacterized membrane protein/mono/diheme cytochrome c family protein